MINTKVRILNGEDIITEDVYTVIEPADRKGNFLIQSDSIGKKLRVHPTRMLTINPDGSPVYRLDTELRASCPHCKTSVLVEIAQNNAFCVEHGCFDIDWGKIDAGIRPAAPEPSKKPSAAKGSRKNGSSAEKSQRCSKVATGIDFVMIRGAVELWTRTGVEFDYPGYEVKAHVLIIEDGENTRKMCFNSYNGTWGKKNKDDDLQHFIRNEAVLGGRVIGYYIKGDLDQERKKLTKNGYGKED